MARLRADAAERSVRALMKPAEFWWRHARVPLIVFALSCALLASTHADTTIARTFFFDSTHMRWLGAGSWWANDFLHKGGRWLIRGVVAIALAALIASYFSRNLRGFRRPCAYFVVAAVLSVGTVGLLKTLTNVDCPWDLQQFGGQFPLVELFADRPDELRRAQCFPAAHASSGYALLALYFAFRERRRLLARLGLGAGIVVGLVFGIAQQSRGAHFVSHDLWSAFLVWMISLTLYAFVFEARLWSAEQRPDPECKARHQGHAGHEAPVATGRLVAGERADVLDRPRGLAGAARQ